MKTGRMRMAIKRRLRSLVELVSSMRFAIAALVLVAITTIIGTIIPQKFPRQEYLNQFGEFWFFIFNQLSLFNVYNATWFLCIFSFLLISTALCVWRSTPKIFREMRSFREKLKLQNLIAMGAHVVESSHALSEADAQLTKHLAQQGFKTKAISHADFTLISAKKGVLNRVGYWLTHIAIIVIALGALLDSDLPLDLKMWREHTEALPMQATKWSDRNLVSLDTFSFRGNVFIPEGSDQNYAEINVPDGRVFQALPFSLSLKQFTIEHYPNGMPRAFMSDVVLTDNETKEQKTARIQVNEPLIYKGYAIYQSGFDDGGSSLNLNAHRLLSKGLEPDALGDAFAAKSLTLKPGDVLSKPLGLDNLQVQINKFSLHNVRDDVLTEEEIQAAQADINNLDAQLGSAAKAQGRKKFHDVGPSIEYKIQSLLDGNALSVQQFMLPITLDGISQYVALVQASEGNHNFAIRLPADHQGKIDGVIGIYQALQQPKLRQQAVLHYLESLKRVSQGQMPEHFIALPQKLLDAYAEGGLPPVKRLIDELVIYVQGAGAVSDERAVKLRNLLIDFLRGTLWELYQIHLESHGLAKLEKIEQHKLFLETTMFGLSTLIESKMPLLLQMTSFKEVKATILQVSKSPGEGTVFFGALLLVLGMLALFFIPMQRVWFGLVQTPTGCQVYWVFHAPRKTLLTKQLEARLAAQLDHLLIEKQNDGIS